MHRFVVLVHSRWYRHGDRGASLVEYALLLALIALATVAAVTFLGDATARNFNTSGSSILGA